MHLKNVFSYYRMCSLTIALCVATRHTLNRHTRARCICFLIFSFFVSLLRRRTRDMRDLSSLFFFFSFFSFSESLLRRHTGATRGAAHCLVLPFILNLISFFLSISFFHLIFPSHFSISFFSWYSQRLCSLALCAHLLCVGLCFAPCFFFPSHFSISFFYLIFWLCSLALCAHLLCVGLCFVYIYMYIYIYIHTHTHTHIVCSLALCWLVFCALQLSSYIKYSRRCSWSWTKRLS